VSDADDVLAANESFYVAFAARDLEAMDRLWAESVPVTCVHPGWSLLSGRDDVLGSWRAILTNPQQARLVSGGATARIFGDAAVVVCREFVAGNPLLATNVFIREDGRWRMMHHHSGPVMQTGA
jgi:ketosteroid isomerase-like protein